MVGIGIGCGVAFGGKGPSGPQHLTSRQIAQELLAPTRHWYLVSFGDSRMAFHEPTMAKSSPHIALSGCIAYGTGDYMLTAGGACASALVAVVGNTAITSPYGLGEITWFPHHPCEARFNGSNVGSTALARRVASLAMSSTSHPSVWARWIATGRAVKLRSLFWRHAGAANPSPGIAMYHCMGTWNFLAPNNYIGTETANFTGSGYADLSVTIPAGYDWATNVNANATVEATASGASTNLQTLSWARQWYELDGAGVTWLNHARGGSSIEGYLDTAIMADSLWATGGYYQTLGEDQMLWIDLGTNNPFVNTQAQHEAKLEALIARHRAVFPLAPVILSTAFASSTSGANPYWKAAAVAVAARVPGCLLLDTFAVCPTYADAVTLGYMADLVHYTAAGSANLYAQIDSLVVAAAA